MGYLVCVECGTRNWDWGGGIADQKFKKKELMLIILI